MVCQICSQGIPTKPPTTQKPPVGTSGNARQSSMSASPMFCEKEKKRTPEEALAPDWRYMGLLTAPLGRVYHEGSYRSYEFRARIPKDLADARSFGMLTGEVYAFLFMSDAVFSRSSRAFFSCSVSICRVRYKSIIARPVGVIVRECRVHIVKRCTYYFKKNSHRGDSRWLL